MSPVQEFQRKHGEAWSKIVRNPAFADAMTLLNVEKMQKITELSPEQIHAYGPEILADLVGHVKHENDLFTLHEHKSFDLGDLPPEDYSTPSDEEESPKRKRKKKD